MSDFFTSRFQTISNFLSGQSFDLKNVKELFVWDFWTESSIAPSSSYTFLALIAISVFITGLFIWKKALKKRHKITPVYDWPINQINNIVVFSIVMTISYWFFRSQQLAYLSSRAVILLSIIVIVGWLVWTVFYLQKKISHKRVTYLEKERFFRYLPKSKKVRN